MKNFISMKRFIQNGLCVFTALALLQAAAIQTVFAENGTTEIGEVLNCAEQGTSGVYKVTKSGYYLINLRGANGGKGQDVHIESDGVGNTFECTGNGYGYGGAGAEGGNVSTLVYLKKGQTLSYNIGADGTNYIDVAYRWENLQRGCIHVYPNSNPIYEPDEYVDAGFGGGGGEGTYVSLDGVILAGAAGGGGGGGSVAKCANWGEGSYYGFKDPSGEKSEGKDGGEASAVSEVIAETFTSVESFNGTDGGKAEGESVQTGESWPAVYFLWKELAPKAPKYKLTKFEAGEGGTSGTSYVNTAADCYSGDDIPDEVSSADVYKNASVPQTSGIVITFVFGYNFPVKVEFTDGKTSTDYTINSDETVEVTIPKPDATAGYFKGWFNKDGEKLVREYGTGNTIEMSYDDIADGEYTAEWYDESSMGKAYVSNAKAQAVTLANGQKAIRFLAAVDSGYKGYTKAGFILSKECETPTVEAGYKYSAQSSLYKSIFTQLANGETTYINVSGMKDIFVFGDCAGMIYTNLIISDENAIYNATPYIITDGEYVYGQSRTVSYGELTKYDAVAANN